MPVTINNPQQVNIAADGGQQVSVQAEKKTRRKVKALPESSGERVNLGKARKGMSTRNEAICIYSYVSFT